MKYLFVHQNFPGQYLHLVRHLLAEGGHDLMFITEPNENNIPGVRKMTHPPPNPASAETHRDGQEFAQAVQRAEMVASAARSMKALGYTPDIIIGHHGWGELLNLGDVWPNAPLLGYHEFYYSTHGTDVGFDPEFMTPEALYPRIRAKNAVNLLALTNPGHGQTPTRFQRSTYPDWAQTGITIVPEGVNLSLCAPDETARARTFALGQLNIEPGRRLVTYVARDLEPYRGFHVIMRALPHLLRARPDVDVVLVGGDGVSYGSKLADTTWREHMLREVGAGLDLARVHFPGKVPYRDYIRLLQRSDAHIYLTYPFVASWSLREAMACGCAIVASDTAPVREFIRHGRTGLLTPCLDPKRLTRRVLEILDNEGLANSLRTGARQYAEAKLGMADYLAAYGALIRRLVQA